jgi:AraC-like DNA-binding protein
MGDASGRTGGMRFLLAPGVPGLEVVRLAGAPRSGGVGLHAHDSLIVAAVHAGARRLRLAVPGSPCPGEEHVAGPGCCCVIGPGRMHVCSWDAGSSADCLCIKPIVPKSYGFDSSFDFPVPVSGDARLHAAVRACAEACESRPEQVAELLRDVLLLLGELHLMGGLARASRAAEAMSAASPAKPLVRARALLERDVEASDGPARCAELARAVGLSPWALSRGFARAFGAPPRDYALDLRVRAAKKRLAQGDSPAYVALETGFFDQSHLTRRFRALVGLTPGQYAAAFGPPSDPDDE